MKRIMILGGIAVLLIIPIIFILSSSEPRPVVTDYPLITSVDTSALARLLNMDMKDVTSLVNSYTIDYVFSKKQSGKITGFSIGVSPDIKAGQYAFNRYINSIAISSIKAEKPIVGDQFAYWPGRKGKHGWSSRCVFRRMNCIFSFTYAGEVPEMIELVKKIDDLLLTSNVLATKGNTVVIPAVTISAPKTVPIGGMAAIKVQSSAGVPIQICLSAQTDFAEAGSVRFAQSNIEGKHTVTILMATSGNVIFTREVTIEVVSKEEYYEGKPLIWDVPGDILYFLTDPKQKWDSTADVDREWIIFASGTFQYIWANDEQRRYQELALADIQRTIKPEWLPAEPVEISVALNHEIAPPVPVAYCYYTLKEKGANIAYRGDIGNGYFLYVEQPYPLPKETKEINSEDILLPALVREKAGTNDKNWALPKIEISPQSFIRYRSFNQTKKYQQVRIVLIKVKFTDSLFLKMPNFK